MEDALGSHDMQTVKALLPTSRLFPLLGIFPKNRELRLKTNLVRPRSYQHYSQQPKETTQMSLTGQRDKENEVYTYNGNYSTLKKEETLTYATT